MTTPNKSFRLASIFTTTSVLRVIPIARSAPQATASAPTLDKNVSHGRLTKLCQPLPLVNQSFLVSYSNRVMLAALA
jgi:hypothetical protein